jgi:hypothetical protein
MFNYLLLSILCSPIYETLTTDQQRTMSPRRPGARYKANRQVIVQDNLAEDIRIILSDSLYQSRLQEFIKSNKIQHWEGGTT